MRWRVENFAALTGAVLALLADDLVEPRSYPAAGDALARARVWKANCIPAVSDFPPLASAGELGRAKGIESMTVRSLDAAVVGEYNYACGAFGPAGEKAASLLEEARLGVAKVAEPRSPSTIPLTKLIGYVIDRHHVYARRQVGAISALLAEFTKAHEEGHPGFARVRSIFKNLRQELLFHMDKEEVSVFPRIIRAEAASGPEDGQAATPPSSIRDALRMLMREHDELCSLLDEMRAATNDYSAPEGGCESYGTLYRALNDLETDLLQHIYLEDRLLFPRVPGT